MVYGLCEKHVSFKWKKEKKRTGIFKLFVTCIAVCVKLCTWNNNILIVVLYAIFDVRKFVNTEVGVPAFHDANQFISDHVITHLQE